jgi:tetratricopeptide (TPR) repeat protein
MVSGGDHGSEPGDGLPADGTFIVLPVRDITDPVLLGVRPARPASPGASELPALPPYIGRSADGALRDLLTRSGFVLLIGDSATGKTRTAYEAVRAVLPEHIVVAPQDRDDVAVAIKKAAQLPWCVLWLDDVYRLAGPEGLTSADVARLIDDRPEHHRVILATITVSDLAKFTDRRDDANRRVNQAVLTQAHRVALARMFDQDELRRARQLAGDPRIADALKHPEYGLPEYLAAGPELFDLWQAESLGGGPHARGAALISAAVDCRRAGLYRPLSADLIQRLHLDYLPRTGRSGDVESLESAWDWATQAGHVQAPLTLVEPDGSRYQVFSYLVDEFERRATPADNVPGRTLMAALREADPTESMRIGQNARNYGSYRIALQAFTQAAEGRRDRFSDDNRDTLTSRNKVGRAMRSLGRLREAEAEHRDILRIQRRVFSEDDPDTLTTRDNLARALRAQGYTEEAERQHRAVLEARIRVLGDDHPDTLTSRNNLARAMRQLGRPEEAVREHRAIVAARTRILVDEHFGRGEEHPDTLMSRNDLARALRDMGRLDEAEAEHGAVLAARIRVLGEDHPDTLVSRSDLAGVLLDLGRLDEAVSEYRAALLGNTRVLGEEHYHTRATRQALAELEELINSAQPGDSPAAPEVTPTSASWRSPVSVPPGGRVPLPSDLLMINGRWPQVREISDPTVLGVRRSRTDHPHGADAVVPYVTRDIDGHLRGLLEESGFVLLVGPSATGRTRTAYEAAAEMLPGHLLVAPQKRSAVAVAIEVAAELHKCVLWLDEFYRLAGPEGLTSAHVDRLIGDRKHHRVILASISDFDLARFTDQSDSATRQTNRDVIRQAHIIRMNREWTDSEVRRLREQGVDPSIADAMTNEAQRCLPLYLIAGSEVFGRWAAERDGGSAHPRGAALISAAVDCRRAGMLHPPSRTLITELHRHYLEAPNGSGAAGESVEAAWRWARTLGPAIPALTLIDPVIARRPHETVGVEVLNYLVDEYERMAAVSDHVPNDVLEGTLREADATEAMRIGQTARDSGRFDIAFLAFSQAADDRASRLGPDHPDTLAARDKRARARRFRNELAEAEREHREVIEAQQRTLGENDPATLTSRDNLARVLRALGRLSAAEEEERAVLVARTRILGADNPDTLTSRNGLARILHALGQLELAESEFHAVVEARTRILGPDHRDTLTSRNDLAAVLAGSGRTAEAKAEYQAAVTGRMRVLGADHPDTRASQAALDALS